MAKQKSRFPSYGLVRGPSHEGGGVAGMVAGEQPVELEGGEWIIPKEAVPDYLPVLKQITNQGRAMQQMQNGNSAMDALIASASMEAGISQPKSPMFQAGGQMVNKRLTMTRPVAHDLQRDRDKFRAQSILSIPAEQVGGEEGLRYYLSDPQLSDDMQMARTQADFDARAKMAFAPEDSLPAALVEGYFDRQNKKSPLDFLKKLIGKEQGGMIDEYQDGGEVSWDDFTAPEEYNTHLVQSKVYDKMSQRNGKTNDYADSLIKNIALSEAGDPKQYTMDRMMEQSTSGNGAKQFGVIEDSEFKDFESGLQMGSELTATPRFKVEKEYAKEGDLEKRTGSSREQVSLGGLPGLSYLANLASKSGVSPESLVGKFFNAPLPLTLEKDIPTGKKSYKLGYSPRYKEQGGMINQYGHGGQMQPRKQQEIRNPETYGPPLELMGPDTTGEGFQQMLNQMRMRDVNQSINPFTGDSLDIEGDSLKLLQRMQKSKMPRAGRKSMQNGGRVDEHDFSGLNTLSRFPNFNAPMSNPEFEAHMQYGERGVDSPKSPFKDFKEALASGEFKSQSGQSPESFMGSLERDNRVRPADRYEMVEDGVMIQKEVPKLSSAYMNSVGLETPLSRRQQSFLQRRAIAPETLNPQVKSLLGRALVQRLTNEPI